MQVSSRRSQSRRGTKSAERRNGHRYAARSRSGRKNGKRRLEAGRNNGSKAAARAVAKPDPRVQAAMKAFAEAMRYFHRQDFAGAKGRFEKAAMSGVTDITARSRVRIKLCEQRLSKPQRAPKSPEEYYNLGVAELNARDLDSAVEHLAKAAKVAPKHDAVLYALAAAHSLLGNTDTALEHLRSAIALRQENRFLAQHDEDFETLRSDARFRPLLYPESAPGSLYSS
jgi:tetratricopeptide (TPR) repeat protein